MLAGLKIDQLIKRPTLFARFFSTASPAKDRTLCFISQLRSIRSFLAERSAVLLANASVSSIELTIVIL